MEQIKIHEIYTSIQGESTHVGRPCIFIRTSGCKLRCTWCDTPHAYQEGHWMSIDRVMEKIAQFKIQLVEVTGGEPLEQESIYTLLQTLIDHDYEVLLETGGHILCDKVPLEVRKIIDMKCPASKMERHNNYDNLTLINKHDEIKFVIQDRQDFDWSESLVNEYDLSNKATVLFSPVFAKMKPALLVEWIMQSSLNVRFQIQLHKVVWDPEARGV